MSAVEVMSDTKAEESACTPSPSTAAPDSTGTVTPPKEPSSFRADAPTFVPEQSAFRADAPSFVPQAAHAGVSALAAADSDMGTMRQFEELEALLSAETALGCQGTGTSAPQSPVKEQDSLGANEAAFAFLPPSPLPASINGSPDAAHSISLFDQLWSAQAVPDALKDLWAPAEAAMPPQSSEDTATAAAASMVRVQESSGFRADAPTFVPQSMLGGQSDAFSQQLWASPLGVLENPLLATPPPRLGAYREELLETPEKVPFTARSFIAARAKLLAIRAHMGRRPIPKELKVRASYPDPSGGMDMLFLQAGEEEPTTGNPVAGALLLSLVRGEQPELSKEGTEQGAQLLSLFNRQADGNGHRFKKDFSAPHAAVAYSGGRREQRPLPGANSAPTVGNSRAGGTTQKPRSGAAPVAAAVAPSRAEIRRAAAAARELEKSSKLEDGVKAPGLSPTAEAGPLKGQSTGRSRNAKRAPLVDPPDKFQ